MLVSPAYFLGSGGMGKGSQVEGDMKDCNPMGPWRATALPCPVWTHNGLMPYRRIPFIWCYNRLQIVLAA